MIEGREVLDIISIRVIPYTPKDVDGLNAQTLKSTRKTSHQPSPASGDAFKQAQHQEMHSSKQRPASEDALQERTRHNLNFVN